MCNHCDQVKSYHTHGRVSRAGGGAEEGGRVERKGMREGGEEGWEGGRGH